MIKILHNPDFLKYDGDHYSIDDLNYVADIFVDNLNDAFSYSQNVDDSWVDNEIVIPLVKGNLRSTSVGDVLEDETGQLWVVERNGFEKLDPMWFN